MTRTKPRLALLRRLIPAASLVPLASHPTAALDQVSELKWKLQFQFAGYYAAIAQGFCRAASFDVAAFQITTVASRSGE